MLSKGTPSYHLMQIETHSEGKLTIILTPLSQVLGRYMGVIACISCLYAI